MAYVQHEWVSGEVITEALMDHLETQYDEALLWGARAWRDTAVQTIPDSALTLVFLNAESYDDNNEFDTSSKVGTDDRANGEGVDHLIDNGLSQFAAGDVGAWVWNTTDNTYATVTGFNDAGDLTLSAAIFTVGEAYIIYRSAYTATVAGNYSIAAQVNWNTPVADKRYSTEIYLNGAAQTRTFQQTSIAERLGVLSCDIVYLAIADYVQLYAWHNAGGAETIENGEGYIYLAIHKISN